MAKNFVLVLFLFCAPGAGSCASLSDRPLPQLFTQSKLIVAADIVSVEGRCEENSNPCRAGFVYEILPRKNIKGDVIIGKSIKVCSLSTIQLDSDYVLFVEEATKWNSRENCDYSFALDSDGVFKLFGEDYYRLGSPMSQMILHGYGQTYYSNAILFPDFEKVLAALFQQKGAKEINSRH